MNHAGNAPGLPLGVKSAGVAHTFSIGSGAAVGDGVGATVAIMYSPVHAVADPLQQLVKTASSSSPTSGSPYTYEYASSSAVVPPHHSDAATLPTHPAKIAPACSV